MLIKNKLLPGLFNTENQTLNDQLDFEGLSSIIVITLFRFCELKVLNLDSYSVDEILKAAGEIVIKNRKVL